MGHAIALTDSNRDCHCHSSKQDQDRQQQLARQRLVTWQQKDQSEMSKVNEELKTLETGTKPVPVSSTSIGALQVCTVRNVQRFDFVSDLSREDENISRERELNMSYDEAKKTFKSNKRSPPHPSY